MNKIKRLGLTEILVFGISVLCYAAMIIIVASLSLVGDYDAGDGNVISITSEVAAIVKAILIVTLLFGSVLWIVSLVFAVKGYKNKDIKPMKIAMIIFSADMTFGQMYTIINNTSNGVSGFLLFGCGLAFFIIAIIDYRQPHNAGREKFFRIFGIVYSILLAVFCIFFIIAGAVYLNTSLWLVGMVMICMGIYESLYIILFLCYPAAIKEDYVNPDVSLNETKKYEAHVSSEAHNIAEDKFTGFRAADDTSDKDKK